MWKRNWKGIKTVCFYFESTTKMFSCKSVFCSNTNIVYLERSSKGYQRRVSTWYASDLVEFLVMYNSLTVLENTLCLVIRTEFFNFKIRILSVENHPLWFWIISTMTQYLMSFLPIEMEVPILPLLIKATKRSVYWLSVKMERVLFKTHCQHLAIRLT